MRKKNLVICFSTSSYDAPIWTNKQHLMTRLSLKGTHKILYIDQGMSWFYIKRAIKSRSFKYFFSPIQKQNENLLTISPYFLPLLKGGLVKKVSWFLIYLSLKLYVSIAPYEKLIYWIYQPQAWYFVKNLRKKKNVTILYDCVDEFETQPFYSKNKYNKEELVKIEEKLCRKSDIVTTTSHKLYNDKIKFNSKTHYVHNVGDFDHFRFKKPYAEKPYDLPKSDSCFSVVYAGVIDDYKTDLELIKWSAENLHDSHLFIFIGPIRVSNKKYLNTLKEMENIIFLGQKPYKEIPFYLHHADYLWLPYVLSSHTNSVFPIKLFEYMATGRPIIARELSSIARYSNLFNVFREKSELITLLKQNENKNRDERIYAASQNTWETRLDNLLSYIQ